MVQIEDEKDYEIRPEYLKKLKKIMKGKHYRFESIEELRKTTEK